jgi:hypothetical protein
LIKTLLECLKQELDETKLAKYYLSFGLSEEKAIILKESVN